MENNPKSQVVERLKEAQNVLITVSTNPSVDQLAAAIGFTLMMNKLGKHATAVFSGQAPSTIEFLKPNETLEQNTDSLRDFIIALDKAKADKLRYKVEDDFVKIFITPYRTSLSADDLNFSQGDFNVDVVIALGVDQRDHVDQAILQHGRILHDATVIGVMAGQGQVDVGSINWQDPSASSLCEMLVSISESFQSGLLDEQMATAFLTGIVAETDRFSNQKTSPKVMTMSAQLMAAGANQQLIATELTSSEAPLDLPAPVDEMQQENPDEAVLDLRHEDDNIHIDEQGGFKTHEELAQAVNEVQETAAQQTFEKSGHENVVQPLTELPSEEEHSKFLGDEPQNAPKLTANTEPEQYEQSVDPLSHGLDDSFAGRHEKSVVSPLLSVSDDAESPRATSMPSTEAPLLPSDGVSDVGLITPIPDPNAEIPEAPADIESDLPVMNKLGPDVAPTDTLADIETAVQDFSGVPPHVSAPDVPEPAQPVPQAPEVVDVETPQENPELSADAARQAVLDAVNASGSFDANRPDPIQALNAQEFTPVEQNNPEQAAAPAPESFTVPPLPPSPLDAAPAPEAPPTVPPPLMTNQFPLPGADVYEPDQDPSK